MTGPLKAGDRVRTTARSSHGAGIGAVVVDPHPFESDGQRRVQVRLDGAASTIRVLPASVEPEEDWRARGGR